MVESPSRDRSNGISISRKEVGKGRDGGVIKVSFSSINYQHHKSLDIFSLTKISVPSDTGTSTLLLG